jgi:ABC-type multidrug transport system ATPase subunit
MIDGVDAAVDTIAVRKRIGFADPAFLTERGLRVGEYLRFLGRVRRVPVPGPDALRLRRWLSPVRLDPGSSIASLDGRERAVLAATAALLVRPAALFLDDPFAGLDAGTLTALVERIDDARQRGAAVVVRTNDEAALSALEARVVTLVSGRVSEPIDGTAA